MGCGTKCIQYLMFFFNVLFLLAGGALVAITVWVLVDQASFSSLVVDVPHTLVAVYIILGVGCFLVVVSFLGCCGALKKNTCMLGTFFVLLLIIFLAEIVGAVMMFVYSGPIKTEVVNSMNDFNNGVNETEINDMTQAWNSVQTVAECCGLNGVADWDNKTAVFSEAGAVFPASCCKDSSACSTSDTADAFPIGCEERFNLLVYIIGGVGAGVLLLELLGMILTCVLMRSAKDDYYG